jgi:hypothetical protein
VPYAIAHPLAVIPLARALGRHAVPSALAIGSVVPDAWYLVPGVDRPLSHTAPGLLLFCLPAGLALYVLFHLLLKEPLLSLLPPGIARRAAVHASPRFPERSWFWVCACLVLGAATHQAWDAFTHGGPFSREFLPFLDPQTLRVLQHASTALGTAVLAGWTWAKLKAAPKLPSPALASRPRRLVVGGVLAFAGVSFGAMLLLALPELELRQSLRAAAVAGALALGGALSLYGVLFRIRKARSKAGT